MPWFEYADEQLRSPKRLAFKSEIISFALHGMEGLSRRLSILSYSSVRAPVTYFLHTTKIGARIPPKPRIRDINIRHNIWAMFLDWLRLDKSVQAWIRPVPNPQLSSWASESTLFWPSASAVKFVKFGSFLCVHLNCRDPLPMLQLYSLRVLRGTCDEFSA